MLTLGHTQIPSEVLLFAVGCALVLGLGVLALALMRLSRVRALEAVARIEREREMEDRVAALARTQSEIAGRLGALGEMMGQRQDALTHAVADRLDRVSQRLGEGLAVGAQQTAEQLQKLEGRLAVLDAAREHMGSLADQVIGLKAILANRPARGAFGQGRMEAIIRDALPPSAYSFQAQLSTAVRPDCLVHLPGDGRGLAIDAKFPLEAFEALRRAADADARERAAQQLRQDVLRHVKDIAEKYLLPGETQDVALLFVPSEALYAELHEGFEDVIARAHRARVLLVSPSLLLLAIQLVQGLVRDEAMRAQAHLIQAEVGHLMGDLGRLSERVAKLKSHMGQTGQDLEQIEITAAKIARRGLKIEQLEFGEDAPAPARPVVEPLPNPLARRPAAE